VRPVIVRIEVWCRAWFIIGSPAGACFARLVDLLSVTENKGSDRAARLDLFSVQ